MNVTFCTRCGHSSDEHRHDDENDNHELTDPECPFRCVVCDCPDFLVRCNCTELAGRPYCGDPDCDVFFCEVCGEGWDHPCPRHAGHLGAIGDMIDYLADRADEQWRST